MFKKVTYKFQLPDVYISAFFLKTNLKPSPEKHYVHYVWTLSLSFSAGAEQTCVLRSETVHGSSVSNGVWGVTDGRLLPVC